MKLRFFFASLIFLFSGLVARGQVQEMYYQGFETGETQAFTMQGGTEGYSTTYYMGGSRSMYITQSSTGDVTLLLSELDFTQNTSLRYISLEFDQICDVASNGTNPVCRIFYKRANEPESQWHSLTSQYYDMTDGGSSNFGQLSSFARNSYPDWSGTMSNESWKSERFNLNDVMTAAVATSERRLMIKFVVKQNTVSGVANGRWYLDNIRVRASSSMMIHPNIKMVSYPDGYYHPSSRGARIELEATTTISAGINPDSVYLFYRVGSDPTPIRMPMTPVAGTSNRYGATIPFHGYDTTMAFYCVVRDATSNANMEIYPRAGTTYWWIEYACIRGVEQPGLATEQFTGTQSNSLFPFSSEADGRSEWVFDSALLANAGYGPGQMTALRFTVASHTNTVTHPRLQVRMKNAPTNYHPDMSITANYPFTLSDYMQVVYDSPFTITEANTGGEQTMLFQDTFYYAGKDIVMQLTFNGDVNATATSIRMIPTTAQKASIYSVDGDEGYGANPFVSGMEIATESANMRPALVMTQRKNLPLLYDMGVSELVSPNYDIPMTQRPGSLTVKLKNFGALPVNGVRVSYKIDENVTGYYDWTGTLAGGADQNITISNSINLAAGFHTLKVWVEDTLTVGAQQIRDHEPYNDTSFSEFIVCDGPMNGVRRIGGANADFNSIEEFLFAVSRCGVDDSLVVKLAPGEYQPFKMPYVNGATALHYVVFEPVSGNVTFVSNDTAVSMVDLTDATCVRFRNIRFVRRAAPLTNMVELGVNSANCHFYGCSFIDSVANPAANMRINALISSGYCNSMLIDNCTFVGGKTGVDVRGQASDILSTGNVVRNSHFENQNECAVNATNQNGVVIEKNEMYDVLGNTNYVLLLNECAGQTRVMANKVYTSHGAGAIALNSVTGTSAVHALVANNMVVCNDDGNSNLMRSPFNVITANYADVVYNSVKMTAPQRNNIAAVSFGGGTLQNSRFLNNVVVTLDNTNYAMNYVPGTQTTNQVGHNVYYSLGAVMNRKAGATYIDMAAWRLGEPDDSLSVSVNPNFLNGSRVDLRTFNRLVKGVGIPLATVPTDMFDTVRSTTATCPGAFEFSSLGYDFEPEAMVSPVAESCHMPQPVELVVRLRNSGTNAYNGSGLSLGYKVGNGATHTVAITTPVPAEDTVTIATGASLSLPPNTNSDATYDIQVWTIFANDPNQTNDTNVFQAISKYHPAKPNDDSVLIAYATAATITPTSGVTQWQVYNSTSAPRPKSEIYWYRDTNDAAPFFVGNTLVTDTVRMDTTFYFRQKRNKAIVRITQLEFAHANNTVGLTPAMPYWMSNSRKIALQLTNVGDARANLFGDTIQTISPTSSLNNKLFVFTDSVFIEPGQSLVVQYATGNSANPTMTIHTGSAGFTVAYNSKVAFVYRHGGKIEDAVAMNNIGESSTQAITWANSGVPSYVWSGAGVNVSTSNTAAGLIRTNFNGNSLDWTIASNANPMFLNTNNSSWIRYTDNGCEGYFAKYKVKLLAPPTADLDLEAPVLPESACGMGMENISVRVHNYGIQSVNGVVLHYCAGGDTVTENVSQTIPANGYISYTFSNQLNMSFGNDSLVTVKVWADSIGVDPTNVNDTSIATVWVPYTPAAPAAMAARTVSYATADTVTLATVPNVIPVWYDYDGTIVDTGYTHISEILYVGGTCGVSYMVTDPSSAIVGTGASQNANTAFPAPYQPGSKFAKQQYIYSASELRAAGLKPGNIDSLAFELKAILGSNVNSISFNEYSIYIGSTDDTIFSGNTDWKNARLAYSRAPFVITQADCNTWVTHRMDNPYYWDGESSVVVQIVHRIATAVTTGVKSAYTVKNNTALTKNGSAELSPSTAEYVGAGSRSGNRPNIRINATMFGCTSAVTPYDIQMVNIPSVDMAVLWPNGVDTLEYNSCNDIAIYANVRNQGATDAAGTKLYYYYDALPVDSVTVSTTIVTGATQNVMLFSRHMTPGRHTVRVIVSAPGDNISSNDTIVRSFMVRFCNGSYTIAPTGGDYQSFGEAIDTLNIVGIQGPVVFNVAPGTYNEQVVLNNIPGSSAEHTIGFIGTGDSVLLTAATTQDLNYVMLLDSASYVTLSKFRIEARPTASGNAGNYGNALVMQKGSHITIDSLTVRVKGSLNNVNGSCVVLMGDISNLVFTNNVCDSGYYSLRSMGTLLNYNDMTITGNVFGNFWYQGINLRGVNNLMVNSNEVKSGIIASNVTGRGLTGIYLAQTSGVFSLQKNKIYLIDGKNGGKRGIQLENVNCIASNPGLVSNNMISCSGTGTAGLTPQKPSGIWIDSSSSYLNVYFNTIRVYCGNITGAYSENSYSFYAGPTISHVQVMNNIFSNFSKGYAYYVSENNTISISNYNAYYTESTRPLQWKLLCNDLAALQNSNSDDGNSVFSEPYFVSDHDLHLVMTNYAGIAQYNADVPDDIDNVVRQQVPGPTIGAHEMSVVTHDIAVVRIIEPLMPANLNFNPPNNMPPHIESDTVRVVAQFYNNGLAPESNVTWYAYLEGHEAATRTVTRNLGNFAPGQTKIDSVMMPTTLGIKDSNIIHVVAVLAGDNEPANNDRTGDMYLAPAFNLAASRMSTDHTGCNMENTIVRIHVKNEGFKDVPAGTTFKIGFHPEITSPANLTISTMPDTVEENTTLANPLLMGQTATINFSQPANFYPTNQSVDIKFRLMGWVNYLYDITQTNDSTSKTQASQSPIIDAFFSPTPPVGYDTIMPYGTWGAVRASQENSIPIRWYRDTTSTFFFPASNQVTVNTANYNRSTLWNNTPQYFHDSTYYVNCVSSKNCPSHFTPVHVYIDNLYENDIAFEEVLAPLGGRVYMENDTVRIRIANYGTRSQTNIPVAYRLKRGNNVLQDVYEICHATIPAGQTYVYTFDSLLTIPTPTQSQSYSLQVWTDLTTDAVRRNDTIRYPWTFSSLPESTYNPSKPGSPTFDITRVSFNEFDFECPQLGRGLTDLATFADPDYPVVHVNRGLTDSIIVQVSPLDATAQAERLKVWVFIDFDRNGFFTNDEAVVNGDAFYDNAIYSNQISIAPNASFGYMRMRIAVGTYADFTNTTTALNNGGIPADKDGHNIDVLLFVDPEPPALDLAVTQIVSPRSYLIRDEQPREISFRIANKGTMPISNPEFSYRFVADTVDPTAQGTVTYNGTLQPGTSAVLTLPAHIFPLGVSDLNIWHDLDGDENRDNNSIEFQYNRFRIIQLVLDDDFEGENKWYAPKGYNRYTHNYWERGIPAKQRLNAAYSDSNAWVTDLHEPIVTGKRGNVSYLYSPIINIAQIKADTISFRLRRNLTNGSALRLEFYNFENKWVNVDVDSLTNWYNNTDDACFDNSTTGAGYNYYWIPSVRISGEYNELLQFRFVYTTPMGTSTTASYGEGCAIDDFHVGRARRKIDAGVIDITYPTAPAYGQTICPEVVVYNYGTDTLRHIDMGYIHYGTYLPKESHFDCLIPPECSDTFAFTSSFVVASDFPDTFSITAFTSIQEDIYNNNDSCTRSFPLSPLGNDISAHGFVYPLDNAVAGDSLQVTLRIRNFGSDPIATATASYFVNGQEPIVEEIDFNALLGRPLRSMEYFNYTFSQRFRASMGVMKITGVIKSPQNDYIYNDTVSKRVEGINSVLDLAASAIIVDTSDHNVVRISLVIENQGARGANGFEVAYYIDGDTNTVVREIYGRSHPLPALQTGYHTFDQTLPNRSAGYSNVTGFLHIVGDNDNSNDTTSAFAVQHLDIELLKLIVVENAAPNCMVIAVLRNNGNIPLLTGQFQLKFNINGENFTVNFPHRIEPGQTIYHPLVDPQNPNRYRIQKSPNRTYVGNATLVHPNDIENTDNNQTNLIEIRGYWEGVPFVETNTLVLDQNYPNPFDDRTTIPFSLPNEANVRFFVIDAMGHIVNTFTQHYPAGAQSIVIDMASYPSGIYYYGIEVDGKRLMKKMLLR